MALDLSIESSDQVVKKVAGPDLGKAFLGGDCFMAIRLKEIRAVLCCRSGARSVGVVRWLPAIATHKLCSHPSVGPVHQATPPPQVPAAKLASLRRALFRIESAVPEGWLRSHSWSQ